MTFEQNIALRMGRNAALLIIFWELLTLLMRWTNKGAGQYSYFLNLVFLLLCILLGFQKLEQVYRKEEPSFGVRFKLGVSITLVAALSYALASLLIYHVLMPNALEDILAQTKNRLLESRATDAVTQKTLNYVRHKYTIQGILVTHGLATLAQGVFLSAILAGALRNTRNLFPNKKKQSSQVN